MLHSNNPNAIAMQPKEITIYQRIAHGGDSTVQNAQVMLAKYGVPKATGKTDLAKKLTYIVAQNGEASLADIADIHPDKDFILANATDAPKFLNDTGAIAPTTTQPAKYNCACGCGTSFNDAGQQATAHKTLLEEIKAIIPVAALKSNPENKTYDTLAQFAIISIVSVGAIALIAILLNQFGFKAFEHKHKH